MMSKFKTPVLFIGHGSPMNIINQNTYTQSLQILSASLPKPEAILVVSAHWLTRGTFICGAEKPKQIYDFIGFPDELYKVEYHPPGAPIVARSIVQELGAEYIHLDTEWGIDHALWAVLIHLFPKADIPVLEMSLDVNTKEQGHYVLAQKLSFLRKQNVLIIGSGNIVHNLSRMKYREDAEPYPWVLEFDHYIKEALLQKDIERLIRYKELNKSGINAVPTNDHYLPMLYSAALREEGENIIFFHESIQNASISMRCFIIQ